MGATFFRTIVIELLLLVVVGTIERIDPNVAFIRRAIANDGRIVGTYSRRKIFPAWRKIVAVRIAKHDGEVAEDLNVRRTRESPAAAFVGVFVPPMIK